MKDMAISEPTNLFDYILSFAKNEKQKADLTEAVRDYAQEMAVYWQDQMNEAKEEKEEEPTDMTKEQCQAICDTCDTLHLNSLDYIDGGAMLENILINRNEGFLTTVAQVASTIQQDIDSGHYKEQSGTLQTFVKSLQDVCTTLYHININREELFALRTLLDEWDRTKDRYKIDCDC